MNSWITIATFTLPQDAYLAKSLLENEGIKVFLQDELTVQVDNFYSNAVGGVKLQVHSNDLEQAKDILIETGYLKIEQNTPNPYWGKFDRFTSKLPFIGKVIVELRLLIIVGSLLFLFFLPLIIASF